VQAAQLEVEPAEALVRLRAHAYAAGRSATGVARDILDRRLRLRPTDEALIAYSTPFGDVPDAARDELEP
jgi:hypothetical protein